MTEQTQQNNAVTNSIELIDATQNAVIKAVGNVSEILEKAETKTQPVQVEEQIELQEKPPFYGEAEFWVGMAFVILVVALFMPISKIIKTLLQAKIDGIVNRIDSSIKLHDDAQILLAQYERKLRSAQSDADEIIARAKNRIEAQKQEQLEKLEVELRVKTAEMENHIQAAIDSVKKEILQKVCELSVQTATKVLQAKVSDADKDMLIDASIEKIKNLK